MARQNLKMQSPWCYRSAMAISRAIEQDYCPLRQISLHCIPGTVSQQTTLMHSAGHQLL